MDTRSDDFVPMLVKVSESSLSDEERMEDKDNVIPVLLN
jgi:hypothetical protein